MKRNPYLFKFFLISIVMLGAFSNNLQSQTTDELVIKHATEGNYYQLKQLLENDANPNAKDENGSTSLIWAAYKGNTDICKLLIKYGADINAKNNTGYTAYDYANEEIKELLSQSGGSISTDELVIKHATEGNYYQLKQLLENGANANAKDDTGGSALMRAATIGKLEICQLLIDHGADVNAKNNDGETALTLAAGKGNKEIMDLLLSKGADKAGALNWTSYQFWYCVNNGYTNKNCIDKVSLTIENLSHLQITNITFMLYIKNKEDNSVIYKKRHTIYMQLYPGEKYACDPFPLPQPLYINANDYYCDVEFISAQ